MAHYVIPFTGDNSSSITTGTTDIDNIDDIDIESLSKANLIVVDSNDILEALSNDLTDDEKLITEAIIDSLESFAIENIRKHKVVSLPYMGRAYINPKIKFFEERRDEIKQFKKTATKSELKEYLKNIAIEAKEFQTKSYLDRKKDDVIKKKHRATYEELYAALGKEYADAYIVCNRHFKAVDNYDENVNFCEQVY